MSALSILAAAGSALVLTQSSITAPLRDALGALAEGADTAARARADLGSPGRADRLVPRAFRLAAKLTSCPMCAGFWIGLAWAVALGSRGVVLVALGFAGSLVSALLVALWLALSEAHAALALWRYLKTPDESAGQRD